jgi:putative acetyltransferase
MTVPVHIRRLRQGDESGVDALLRAAFGGEVEVGLVRRLRADGDVLAELVAVNGELVVGHVLFSPLALGPGERLPNAASLAPLAVLPDLQREGVGRALVAAGLALLAREGVELVVVVGDPAYYGRFGFEAAVVAGLASPYSGPYEQGLWLGRARKLAPGLWLRYPRAFEGID